MKIEKTASGTNKITISKDEWLHIGKQAGWGKDKSKFPFGAELQSTRQIAIEADELATNTKDLHNAHSIETFGKENKEVTRLTKLVVSNVQKLEKLILQLKPWLNNEILINITMLENPNYMNEVNKGERKHQSGQQYQPFPQNNKT